ncbi:FAD-binding oxidoreductase [Aliiglaciecola litoralis]|uniref:FAD-binding oxidoreductase n=1 Tax=Aliiglaciecola litoralis TaxID=582857 RepID=A0ABP3X1W0_9ALTE
MYDPLIESSPAPNQGYPSSYWAKSLDLIPKTNSLQTSVQADVAVIGAGYTGLSAAYHLQKHYAKKVVVVDANEAGWGCSGRNAGFVLPGTGRLSLLEMEDKWGVDSAKGIFHEFMTSIETVQGLIEQGNIDCDKTPGGYLKLAHRRAKVATLRTQAEKLNAQYGESVRFVNSKEVNRDFVNSANMYGGIYFDKCFGVNPLKLALGYLAMANEAGVTVFGNSPVVDWQQSGATHTLRTSHGQITADQVVIATNGYTGTNLHDIVKQRHFPVLSSIIVTRPLTEQELSSIQIRFGLMAMDTRRKKYYYRLLPDNRILFGGRGAITGQQANDPINKQRLSKGLEATFPILKDIPIEHFWSGWVSASYDKYPRLGASDDESIFYSMGYCGSGLAFSTLAGKRLAQRICEPEALPQLPFWQTPLPKFPFSSFRRLGLKAFYLLANIRD